MAYTKTTWVNGSTPVNETNMNNIENGIAANDSAITSLNSKVTALDGQVQSAEASITSNEMEIENIKNGTTKIPTDISLANATTIGGIKADTKTDDDTQPVNIGSDGKLYTKPGTASAVSLYRHILKVSGTFTDSSEQSIYRHFALDILNTSATTFNSSSLLTYLKDVVNSPIPVYFLFGDNISGVIFIGGMLSADAENFKIELKWDDEAEYETLTLPYSSTSVNDVVVKVL